MEVVYLLVPVSVVLVFYGWGVRTSMVAALAFGAVLLVQRRPVDKPHGGGRLELPGGKVEPGEAPRDALARDPTAAAEVDAALNNRRDLWQYAQSPTPCQTLATALKAIQAAPHVDNVDALKAAVPPLMPTAAAAAVDEAEKTACRDVDPLLATVRTAYATAFPDKFKTKKKKPKKRRR